MNKNQSITQSFFEAATSTASAFVLSLLSHVYLIAPWQQNYQMEGGDITTFSVGLGVTIYYTLLSFIRIFIVRRIWNFAGKNKRRGVINVAKDFTKFIGGRLAIHGSFSGEDFRNLQLIPALKKYRHVVINLDGTLGLGYSFLEEAFGGTIRCGYEVNRKTLSLVSADAEVLQDIWSYIDEANKKMLDITDKK